MVTQTEKSVILNAITNRLNHYKKMDRQQVPWEALKMIRNELYEAFEQYEAFIIEGEMIEAPSASIRYRRPKALLAHISAEDFQKLRGQGKSVEEIIQQYKSKKAK